MTEAVWAVPAQGSCGRIEPRRHAGEIAEEWIDAQEAGARTGNARSSRVESLVPASSEADGRPAAAPADDEHPVRTSACVTRGGERKAEPEEH
jgi:hypothetical protein